MTYTRKDFGLELKNKIKNKQNIVIIGRWSFSQYWLHKMEIDLDFQNILKDLSAMENDKNFKLSYQELEAIADKLILNQHNIQVYKSEQILIPTFQHNYTRKQFGIELKEKIQKKEDIDKIALWAFNIYWEYMLQIDDDFQDFLTELGGMSAGPEFQRSYEELDMIADKLIAGEDVKL